jgi:lysophospholipase L1-like esterase
MVRSRPLEWCVRLAFCVAILSLQWFEATAEVFPRVTPLSPAIDQSRRLQRSLNLLEKSNPSRRQTIRILYFGQSFADPTWFTNLINSLKRSYPHANILAENRALDGHYAEQLVRYAESEVYPQRPDLVIYSSIGHSDYIRKQVEQLRLRTSADILLLTDPLRIADKIDEPTDPKVIVPNPRGFRPTPENYFPWLNNVWLPSVAEEFETALADIRSGWKTHLRENHLEPVKLLTDNLRFTGHGHHLFAELLKPWLQPGLWNTPYDVWDNSRVSTYEIPRDTSWSGNRLKLEFTGNRIELVLQGEVTTELQIQIDGQLPSEIQELRIPGRVSNVPGTPWPALLRVGRGAPLLDEEWTAIINDVVTNDAGALEFKFSVTGSKTGPDGEGTSKFNFLSKSHRVEIETADWDLQFMREKLRATVPHSFNVTWPVIFCGRDAVRAGDKPEHPLEATLPIAIGLKSGRHVLELIAPAGPPPPWLKAVRIYRPTLISEKVKK